MTKFENNDRIADYSKNNYGEFVAFIGYKDDHYNSGMMVVDRKHYKREAGAKKLCENWVNS